MANSQSVVSNQQSLSEDQKGESSSSVSISHVKIKESYEFAKLLNTQSVLLNHTLLATALVKIKEDSGRIHKFRILLDQGSECSFVSERAFKVLNPRYDRVNALVFGVGGMNVGEAKKLAHFEILSKEKGCPNLVIKALVLVNLTSYSPPLNMELKNDLKATDLFLADPDPLSDSRIDFIIGADKYGDCLLPGLEQGFLGCLTAQASIFGWILSGPVTLSNTQVKSLSGHTNVSNDTLQEDLTCFWQLEQSPVKLPLTEEEIRCENYFLSTFSRNETGRYMVRLPFNTDFPISIGNSLQRAKIILSKVMQRISRDENVLKQYVDFMSEYLELGHMKIVERTNLKDAPGVVYIPHHPIIRESSTTTKLRVVFNASSLTSNGTSLNSHFFIGQKILNDLIPIIMRWREYRYVYLADAEKMFRQILIDPKDWDYQRILWYSDNKLVACQLLTVTYGTACAPFLANRVVKQLAKDEGDNFPLAKPIVENDIYVDDALFGADEKEEAKETQKQRVDLMKCGGLHLRKWASNDATLLENCPEGKNERAIEIPFDKNVQLKVLGLIWDPISDNFQFKVSCEEIVNFTKRKVLSFIAKLYDPFGWLAPVIVVAKMLIQELWLHKLDWDERLPEDLTKACYDYYSSLKKLECLRISRWTGQTKSSNNLELHGFSDASSRAYGACVYLRLKDDLGISRVTLLFAKSKVAPLDPVSIPRLELCGAVLLAKILSFVMTQKKLQNLPVYCYTDSSVVLAWLNKHPSTWRTFVANRVAQIHKLLPAAKWQYVSTKENPADCVSRGITPSEILNHSLWWKGPIWLLDNLNKSSQECPLISSEINLEQKPINIHVSNYDDFLSELSGKFSSWPKLLRVTAYCKRFISNLIAKITKQNSRVIPESRALRAEEVNQSREFWIKWIQAEFFSIEIKNLKDSGSVTVKSNVRSLNPFLDSRGILRVSGRLRNAPISFDEKHPIILPRHKISHLLVSHAHLRSLHGGLQLTLHVLRQNFWILGARSLVKELIKNCVECVTERAEIPQQLMGNLPDFRVTPSRPFTHTGIDYAGPFDVRFGSGRGVKSQKTYIVLFICCSTRSIHLELVSDYSTSAFLAAFHRFVSRRGKPAHLYSDNAKNFIGADNELRKTLIKIRKDNDLRNKVSTEGISWHFVPPNAPHFGGLWESGVKSVKHHLRRIIGSHKLTHEEFYTLLTRIEASLNSRPIAPLNENAEDFSYLTPGHFLIGAPLLNIPECSQEFVRENRLKRWELVQHISEIFWRKWSSDYLHSLQKRYKWSDKRPNLSIRDMVLIRNDNLPQFKWALGRVIKCYPGKDNLIRSVRVKTADSEFDRPIVKLCLLPIKSNDTSHIEN